MAPSQHSVLALLGLVASVRGISCPACYTQTVAGVQHCPIIPALETPCYEPACIKVVTTTIPGKNPACSITPTVTTKAACPTKATCRKGCRTSTKTVTGASLSCGVRWETDPPKPTGGVSWATGPVENTGGVSWATGPVENTGGVSWATGPAESTGGVTFFTDPAPSTGGVSWDTGAPQATDTPLEPTETEVYPPEVTPPNTIGLNPPTASVSWGKRQEAEPTEVPEPTEEEPIPEEPEDTDIFNPFPLPTPTNIIELQPPKSTVIWGKRQDEEEPEPEPTEEA
ncbi:hypothetical protein BCR34DRAFT_389454 [Clohesyomyces aquaticus]|uniref:Uncharacterized protein n=1 Tax=Clohesyomyces aquaticus TaxID=1231657 RepID=A0A1Y1ZFF9_9PLEO|nr:hypothetical protein BCR34DRAFT_389454 [Clohesyomyces aquaticus]